MEWSSMIASTAKPRRTSATSTLACRLMVSFMLLYVRNGLFFYSASVERASIGCGVAEVAVVAVGEVMTS